jgi:hypothetical protein
LMHSSEVTESSLFARLLPWWMVNCLKVLQVWSCMYCLVCIS